jgi:hypothetical protein
MEITLPRVKLETSGLEGFAILAPDLALRERVTLLNRLARNPDFLDAYVFPLLEEPGEAEDWSVAHRYKGEILGEGRAAFNWACKYPDWTGVLAATTVDLRDGEIVRQVVVEASDEYPQGTRSLP